jgi:two-component system cell cycle response regulator
MKAHSIFTGAPGAVYYSSLTIVVIALMLILSFRLLLSRQKRAYLTLSLCMTISLLGQLVLLGAGFLDANGQGIHVLQNLLNAMTFILANLGVYQLYGASTKRVTLTTIILLGIAVVISFFGIANDVYAVLIVAFAYLAIRPLMEEGSIKYPIGMAFYALAVITHLIGNFISAGPAIIAIDNLFRIAFFAVLFLIMFDKVLSLMESSYNKSTRDALTGLYNRVYFYTTVSFLVNDKKPISVIFFDLDNFKNLNDTRGHDEGDKALKAVASILKDEAEEVGLAGRYGGEEMVLLIDDPDVNVGEFAEKIRTRIEDETIVTASIGYASFEEGDSTELLIKNADKAMYVAKRSGKNRVIGYSNLTNDQQAL